MKPLVLGGVVPIPIPAPVFDFDFDFDLDFVLDGDPIPVADEIDTTLPIAVIPTALKSPLSALSLSLSPLKLLSLEFLVSHSELDPLPLPLPDGGGTYAGTGFRASLLLLPPPIPLLTDAPEFFRATFMGEESLGEGVPPRMVDAWYEDGGY